MATTKKKSKKSSAKKVASRRTETSGGPLPPEAKDALTGDAGSAAPKKAAADKSKKSKTIEVPAPKWDKIELMLVGVPGSSLISHAWSKKAITEMLAKQMKAPTQGKTAKDPVQDYLDSMYEHKEGGYGFPSIAFKKAAVGACRYLDMPMTVARGAFHVLGEQIQILGTPVPRQDMVRVGMGTADIRFRGEFLDWAVIIPVEYNSRVISAAQVTNLYRTAGKSLGIGD